MTGIDRRSFLGWAGRGTLALVSIGLAGTPLMVDQAEAKAKDTKAQDSKKKSTKTTKKTQQHKNAARTSQTVGVGIPVVTTAAAIGPQTVTLQTYKSSLYLGQGDRYDCDDFAALGQGYAQQVLRDDPTDPNNLDANRDGIACTTADGTSFKNGNPNIFPSAALVDITPVPRR